MAATRTEISAWFDEGVKQKKTHMIVVCDTYDHEDYPSFVDEGNDPKQVAAEKYGYPGEKNMQRVMEVYDLRIDKAAQMAERRAFHF